MPSNWTILYKLGALAYTHEYLFPPNNSFIHTNKVSHDSLQDPIN